MKLNSILIAFDENYFETGEVMLYSLSKNSAQSFKIHFFYHEMSDHSLNELAQMIEKINNTIRVIDESGEDAVMRFTDFDELRRIYYCK